MRCDTAPIRSANLKEAEIITRSQRTRKNTQRQLKNTKEKINQYIKEKREGNKIKSVVSKLESIDIEGFKIH